MNSPEVQELIRKNFDRVVSLTNQKYPVGDCQTGRIVMTRNQVGKQLRPFQFEQESCLRPNLCPPQDEQPLNSVAPFGGS